MSKEQESIIKFPCPFPIKAMGNIATQDDFKQLVVAIVQAHVPSLNESQVTSRHSKNGKYLAVTVTIEATSQAQLDAIYQNLSDCERVIMAL